MPPTARYAVLDLDHGPGAHVVLTTADELRAQAHPDREQIAEALRWLHPNEAAHIDGIAGAFAVVRLPDFH